MENQDWRTQFIKNNKRKNRFELIVGLGILVGLIVLNLIFNWTDYISNGSDNKPYDNRGVYLDQDN